MSKSQLQDWGESKRLRNRWFSSRTHSQNGDSWSNNGVGRKGNTLHVVHSINGKITECLDGEQNICLLNTYLISLPRKERVHERRQHLKKSPEDSLETYPLASLKIINYALFTCLISQHYQIQVFHYDSFRKITFLKTSPPGIL